VRDINSVYIRNIAADSYIARPDSLFPDYLSWKKSHLLIGDMAQLVVEFQPGDNQDSDRCGGGVSVPFTFGMTSQSYDVSEGKRGHQTPGAADR